MAETDEALKKGAKIMGQYYPKLTAEAVVAFFYVAANDGVAVSALSRVVGVDEDRMKQHLIELISQEGGGLIQIRNPDTDKTVVLTPKGKAVAGALENAL